MSGRHRVVRRSLTRQLLDRAVAAVTQARQALARTEAEWPSRADTWNPQQ